MLFIIIMIFFYTYTFFFQARAIRIHNFIIFVGTLRLDFLGLTHNIGIIDIIIIIYTYTLYAYFICPFFPLNFLLYYYSEQ